MEEPVLNVPLSNNVDYFRLSPFISIVITIFVILSWIVIVSTIYAYMNLDYILSHWNTEKCKPAGIMIGGQENLNECVKIVLKDVVGKSTLPLTYGSLALTQIFLDLTKSVQQLRVMFDYLRVSLTNITKEIFGRIVALMIPLQSMFLSVKDMFSRLYAVFATSLYMGIATILTMKKVLEMILTFVIVILISLASLIIIMWIFPFSWGIAAAFTAIFVSISIPLVMFASAIGKVTDLGIPKIPSKPHVCFDKYTKIILSDNQIKPIYKIKVGDVLNDGSKVLSKIRLQKNGSTMYYLNGVLVTGTHLVKYQTTWIPVSFHPNSIQLISYNRNTLYCLNTSSGTINISGNIFTDWNEMLDDDFIYIKKNTPIEMKDGRTTTIEDVKLGDVLNSGKEVTGIAKTFDLSSFNYQNINQYEKYYHLYTK
jgi:hypothetical protein